MPAHAARALHGPGKQLQGEGSRVPSASRGNNGNLGMLGESPWYKPGGSGSGPGITSTDAPEVPRLPQSVLCPERVARGAAGSVGLEGSREPRPGSVL